MIKETWYLLHKPQNEDGTGRAFYSGRTTDYDLAVQFLHDELARDSQSSAYVMEVTDTHIHHYDTLILRPHGYGKDLAKKEEKTNG